MTDRQCIPVDAHLSHDRRQLQISATLGTRLGLPCHGAVSTLDLQAAAAAPVVELVHGDTKYLVANRRLPFQGATNFRDAGGRRASNGAIVAWRQHYRSENLAKLTTADWDTIEELGVSLILDLRHPEESDLAPTKAPSNIKVVQIPIVGRLSGFSDATSALLTGKIVSIDDAAMVAMYLDLVSRHRQDLLEAFGLYRDSELPVLVHCTAGKDRTGIVVALWQLSQGVALREVLEDYSLSSLYRTLPRYLALQPDLLAAHVDPRRIHSYITTQRASLLGALDALGIALP
ncbi:tyrosine-protein phosphatase [Ferrimicrobium sp.]|uniref:tyrosine-protein phosphatase n=1 Tax=Ferrimicrobium sp. TaxID=2926050 RepID=UPI00260C77E8|nr:tyrosine-protein phosphatase [Ferrimicrobium sp.]